MTFRILENRRFSAGLLLGYTAALLACLSVRPLWTDEVLQLIGTMSSPSVKAMLVWIRISVGAVPVGYLTQRPFVLIAGPSTFWARFPSALFSVASCWLLIRICRALNLTRAAAALAVVIFMIAPSQLRYALEARPYSEAMFFGLLAAVGLAKLARDGKVATAFLTVAAMALALYTQAYTFFPICGVGLWYAAAALRKGGRRRATLLIGCLSAAALLFAPWYVLYSEGWRVHMRLSGYPSFHWTRALAMDIFKGISGGAFVCSAAMLFLAGAGLRARTGATGLMASAAIFAAAGPVLEDSLQAYFFASRQILFAIPALAILSAIGFAAVFRKNRAAAVAVFGVFAGASLISDVTFQIRAKEDWRAAALAVARVTAKGYCMQSPIEGSGAPDMYSVFIPSLASTQCGGHETKVAFVSNLTMDSTQVKASYERLRTMGFSPKETIYAGGTTVAVLEK